MNLYALIVFHHVARNGSVTRAADELRISQPAVTMHVRKLSAELGFPLLAPKGRGILLTEAGERVAEHAARLFALQQDIMSDLEHYRTGRKGVLRIAATSLPAHFLLPDWLAAFRLEYPAIEVNMMTHNAHEVIQRLLYYKADLAFIGGGGELVPGLARQLAFQDELWFIVAASHPYAGLTVTLAAMMQERFVLREAGSAVHARLLALCKVNSVQPPAAAVVVNGIHETVASVAAGLGAAYVSSLEAEMAVNRGEVARVIVPDTTLPNPVVLVTRDHDPLPPAAKAFAERVLMRGKSH
ncbi:LysR family transcriptional regulator [Paenibacillus oenotherae]|uniref:LysR family transcriptional regulator n=1 Tax=Paenibacillus oenotherae TaxID=1435645 RepID=A0ABS7D5H8_9BACL|nr:LysR family transcriptional regulator [Paenibacillus oenotherae]MBW7475189.1 LysR family transcriptional regulator [Paenibacillus oenotherae]